MALSGTYTFTNVAFPHSHLTLYGGKPLGAIVGSVTVPQEWIVENGTVKSAIPTITSFASVFQTFQGAPLFGSQDAFTWDVEAVPNKVDHVIFKAPLSDLAWTLTGGFDGAEINLQPVATGNIFSSAQWIAIKK